MSRIIDLSAIRSLPIESVAERLGLRVQKHKALCPFHDDRHPSLTFHRATNTFKCFVCGAHGDVISLAMHVLGKSFYEACKWLADDNNIIITEDKPMALNSKRSTLNRPPDVEYLARFFRQPQLNAEAQRFLFDERHYDPKVIHWLGITSISQPTPCWRYGKPYYDAPSLLFPYRDIDGKLLNVQSRYLGGFTKSIPRFRFPPNGSIHVFNLPILKYVRPDDDLYLTEGITDCIAHLSMHHKAIAIPSSTLLKTDDLSPVAELKRNGWKGILRIYPDKDDAGNRLYHQLLSVTHALGLGIYKHDLPEGCKDYSDFYLKNINL